MPEELEKMANLIQLQVKIGADAKLILLPRVAALDDLIELICTHFTTSVNCTDLRLQYAGEILEYGAKESLLECGLANLSTLTLLLPLHGGIWPSLRVRKRELTPLHGSITVTTKLDEPDMISFDNSPDLRRAKMPCGHVIGPESMTSYCKSLLSAGKYRFVCPSVNQEGKSNCDCEWEYFLVRHVACLEPDELQEFEKHISNNYLKKADGLQKCPGCQTWCYRGKRTENYVRCPLCAKDFCWACLNDWKNTGRQGSCGNSGCDGRDARIRILATCATKEIKGCPACPVLRGCPKCGMLTEHIDACAHVTCSNCRYGFCFICLKSKPQSGNWPCPPSGTCPLAPRQTRLTGSDTTQESSSRSYCTVM